MSESEREKKKRFFVVDKNEEERKENNTDGIATKAAKKVGNVLNDADQPEQRNQPDENEGGVKESTRKMVSNAKDTVGIAVGNTGGTTNKPNNSLEEKNFRNSNETTRQEGAKETSRAPERAFKGVGGAFSNKDKAGSKSSGKVDDNKPAGRESGAAADKMNDKNPAVKGPEKQAEKPANERKISSNESSVSSVKSIKPSKTINSLKNEASHQEPSKPEEEKKHVKIDEKQNESYDVGKGPVAGTFRPSILMNPCEGSKIREYRDADQVAAEGFFWKKRVLFYCFWHQKYFVLLRDGHLVYHKCNGERYAKGNWNIKEAVNFQKIDVENAWYHPYRFAFEVDGRALYFSYDNRETRDYWYDKLESVSRDESKN